MATDHSQMLVDAIDPLVSLDVYEGTLSDEDDDVVRVIPDGGFEAGLEYGGTENRNDHMQVLVVSTDYVTAKDAAETIRTNISPSTPSGYTLVRAVQPFRHVEQDGDDRHYFSARFLCQIAD